MFYIALRSGAPSAPFSDHIFLGIAVSSCAQLESLRACLALRLGPSRPPLAPFLRVLALALGLLLALLCAFDAHFTARHFHAPVDSALAAGAGALAFAIPLRRAAKAA